MGYVRSRKFCCCLPVRFGVFCMALIGIGLGGLISIAGWIQLHKTCVYTFHASLYEELTASQIAGSRTWTTTKKSRSGLSA